jgi:hypothetical protein
MNFRDCAMPRERPLILTRVERAIDVLLSARTAVQLVRDSAALPGTALYEAARRCVDAVDDTLREAQRVAEQRR